MVEKNLGGNVLLLLKYLDDAEEMKKMIQFSLDDSIEALKKANFVSKIFKKNSLEDWRKNKEQCEKDILEYDNQISNIKQLIGEAGYIPSEIKNIQRFLISQEKGHFIFSLEQESPWVNLLTESERQELNIEIAAGRKGISQKLISLTDYIKSFKTSNEKLDFIHGFNPNYKTQVEETSAYKIGQLFYKTKTDVGINLEEILNNYAPKYRHAVEFISLVSDLYLKNNLLDITNESLNKPLEAIEFKNYEQKKLSIEQKIELLQSKINQYKFYGKIDFLGSNGKVGETLYYDNYKNYKKEVNNCNDCGQPITFEEISELDYIKNAKQQFMPQEKTEEVNKLSKKEKIMKEKSIIKTVSNVCERGM